MKPQNLYDIIVIGAGCAGLGLAHAISQLNPTIKILILEKAKSLDEAPKKTWSFWTDQPNLWKKHAWHRWSKWYLSDLTNTITQESHSHQYVSVHSDQYLNNLANGIHHSNSSIIFGQTVLSVDTSQLDYLGVQSNNDHWYSDWVIDTRPVTENKHFELIQSFHGRIITSETPCFNPDTFGLMDELKVNQKTIHFRYILPKDKHTCLIETTCIHPPSETPDLEQHLEKDIQRICGNNKITTQRFEQGYLPMTSVSFQQPKHSRYIRAGQPAGALRPSSGYGFMRIQRWIQQAAHIYHQQKKIPKPSVGSHFVRYMDQIFLNTLVSIPTAAPKIFLSLAKNLSGDDFALFMMEQANMRIWRQVITSLPTKDMLVGWRQTVASKNY